MMNLMFWKKKATAEDSADDSPEKPGGRAESRKSPDQDSPQQKKPRDEPRDAPRDAHGEADEISPAHPNRRLIIGAVVGVLALVAIGLAIWKIFLPSSEPSPKLSLKQDAATDSTPALNKLTPLSERPLIKLPPIEFAQKRKTKTQNYPADIETLKKKNDALEAQIKALKTKLPQTETPQSASRLAEIEALEKQDARLKAEIELLKTEIPQLEKVQAEQRQANIDTLTKQNSELQAQIEAIEKKQRSTPPARKAPGKAKPSTFSGDMSVGTQNPKASAISLKEIIKAMNAASEDPPKKPAK